MAETTDRLALPLLAAGQAQKEIFHNEALTFVDLLLQGAVEDHDVDDPPASPAAGQCWTVGASPSGDWTGRAGQVAGWTTGGWRFVLPRAGMTFWNIAAGCAKPSASSKSAERRGANRTRPAARTMART